MIEHHEIRAANATFHVATLGSGPPLVLLHGWPEFWWTWEPVMQRLADRFRLIAPDLRGFGDSDKPGGPEGGAWGAPDHATDMLAILDAMNLDRVGLVGHDVGGAVIQAMARAAPHRLSGLFLFDFVYPGIGPRMGTPDRLNEIWYQSFHQQDFAVPLLSSSPAACRIYFETIIRHWAHRAEAFPDDVLDAFVANFMKPGNLAGGFAYYRAAHPGRVAMIAGTAPPLPPIQIPTCVRWAEFDPLFPYAWTDRLADTFPNLDLAMIPGVGHFPHREDPDRAASEIAGFFSRL
jgi:pimeloyl-ACP methyl ester carboxylesterase